MSDNSALTIKIHESGIEGLLPNCDGINFFDLPAVGGEERVGAWFCGDDEYEQAVCGIVIMGKNEGGWQVAFHAREAELGTEFIAHTGTTESSELCFQRLCREERSLFLLKCDNNEIFLKEREV